MEIERALDGTLPHDKNGRASSLFIFSEFSDAIRYSVRMTNSKLYKIRGLENTQIFHLGDMNWTEVMNKFYENPVTLKTLAQLYWNRARTFKPCWEFLVDKVLVEEVIISTEGQRKEVRSDFANSKNNIESLGFYTQYLNC
ncbi:MAG: hypothetical protein RIC32_03550 [Ekhidna sp.]|jgi:hypothetical protein